MPSGVYERKADKYPRLKKPRPAVPCSAPGCERTANRPRVGLCEAHYARQRANGTFDKRRTRRAFYVDRAGYVRLMAPGHPAAHKGGVALQHRMVFYDAHGAGPFACHWCQKPIRWDEMHVDHVNSVPSDNRLENLVASCPPCNQGRGHDKMRATMRERVAVKLSFNGETLTIREWAERLGIDKVSLKARLTAGWPLDRALTERRGKFGPRGAR